MIPAGTKFIAINTDDRFNRVWTIDEIIQYASNSLVPYTGATQDVDLGEFGVDAGHIVFDTTPTSVPTDQGTLSWDPDHNTLQIQMNGETGQIMQDTFYFVKNQSGSAIPKGTVVRAAGTLGASGRILIEPFLADGTYPSKYCMGVTAENIPDGDDGMVMHFGQIRQINLSAYSDGDILYASETVAGGFTTTRPNAPNNIITVAIVIHAASNGVLQVRPTFSSNINDDEGVYFATTPTNGNVLTYNGTTGLWEAQAPSGGSGGVTDGDKGDITVSGSGSTWTIDNNAVTNSKINDVSVTKVTGTKSEFNTACTDGDFLYVGDVTQYTDENAQDAVGAMANNGTFVDLTYVDSTPTLTADLSATGTADNTTFLRGDNTWATPTSADPEGWTTIVKSANQDVTNNATLQDDTELQFSVVAGGHYMVEMNVCYSGNDTTGDYKYAFAVSAGLMRMRGLAITYGTTGAPVLSAITANNTAITGNISIGVLFANLDELHTSIATLNFYASQNATFKFQFANNAAAAGRISRTWKGSILRYKRID